MAVSKNIYVSEAHVALTSAQKRLDRYENLLVGHISGLKTLEESLAELVNESVKHYRQEVSNLRSVYLRAIDDLKDSVDQILTPTEPSKPEEEVEEEEDDEDGDSETPPSIL